MYIVSLCLYQMQHSVHRILVRKEVGVQRYHQERKVNQRLDKKGLVQTVVDTNS